MKTPLSTIRRDWVDRSLPLIQQVAATLHRFTLDDIREYHSIGQPPHPNWWGVAIAQMVNLRLIRRVGFRRSKRTAANGRWIVLWETL